MTHCVPRYLFAVILCLVLMQLLLPARGLCAPQAAQWSFLVYVVGDNDLEAYVGRDIFTEFGRTGSNADVNVLVLADRSSGFSRNFGNWPDTQLFYVTKGLWPIAAHAVAGWGERNMGDPATLEEFIGYARTNYPAEHYALVLWNHGWGWRPYQTLWDETDNDTLDMHELAGVLESVGPVDMIGYDACLMQSIEVQSVLRDYADVLVASQDYVGNEGFRYERIIAALEDDPAMTGAGAGMVMAGTMTDRTISAVVLNDDWDALVAAIDQWSVLLNDGLSNYRQRYQEAYSRTQHFGDPLFVDLYDMARHLTVCVPDRGIQAASQAVMDAVKAVVAHNWSRAFYFDGANGMSIFWPQTAQDLDESTSPQWDDFQYYRSYLPFSRLTHWDEFLEAYVAGSTPAGQPSRQLTEAGHALERVRRGAPGFGLPAARGYYSPPGSRRGPVATLYDR